MAWVSESSVAAAPRCPVCATVSPEVVRTFTLSQVATHFIPESRDRERHEELRDLLVESWGGRETVAVHRCPTCSFGFAEPWVAGSTRFYNLVTESDPHYPSDRWEFRRTVNALATERFVGIGNEKRTRLVEVGAGSGAFLKLLRSSHVGRTFRPIAIEYDRGAIANLEQAGFETFAGSLQELAATSSGRSDFGAICLFQTLEHIADVHGTFRAITALLEPTGNVFLSTPYAPSIELQEELARFWDLPPNHVGRWTRSAFEAVAEQHALRVVEWELEPTPRVVLAWRLAVYTVLGKAYDERSLAGRINALRVRSVRGPAKRVVAIGYMPKMLAAWPRLVPVTQWVRLAHRA
jgi:SAM-dependent methyltransferase